MKTISESSRSVQRWREISKIRRKYSRNSIETAEGMKIIILTSEIKINGTPMAQGRIRGFLHALVFYKTLLWNIHSNYQKNNDIFQSNMAHFICIFEKIVNNVLMVSEIMQVMAIIARLRRSVTLCFQK